MNTTAEHFIQTFEEKAKSITDDAQRSKKYRTGIAALAQKSAGSNDMAYLTAAIEFADRVSDEHDRSKAFVDIIRGIARVARNTSDPELARKALELVENTGKGLDRSHALEGIVSAMAEIGATSNTPGAIEESETLAASIEYDTYRSMSWRNIALALLTAGDPENALSAANISLDIIDVSNCRIIYKASAYIELSKLFLDLEQIGIARQCLSKAATIGEGLKHEFDRSSVFGSIAETLARMGARTGDRTLFKDAVSSFRLVTKEFYRTTTYKILKNILLNFDEVKLIEYNIQ